MLASGSDNPVINTINIVGMRRAGITPESIDVIKRAHRLLYRDMKPLDAVRAELAEQLDGIFPFELSTLLNFLEKQRRGKMGRAREIYRNQVATGPRAGDQPEGRMSSAPGGRRGSGGAGAPPRAHLFTAPLDRTDRRRRHQSRTGPRRRRRLRHALALGLSTTVRPGRRGLDRRADDRLIMRWHWSFSSGASLQWSRSRWPRPQCKRARSSGRQSAAATTLQVGHVERFNPAFQEARRLVRNPKYIRASASAPTPFGRRTSASCST